MGEWILTCPRGGVYKGECKFEKTDGFTLHCPMGLRHVGSEEGCEGVVKDNLNPDNPEIPEYCRFTEEKVKPAEYFHPASFRTLCPECPGKRCALCPEELKCATRIIIGCKKEEWDEAAKRCKIGTETHVIYHGQPKKSSNSNFSKFRDKAKPWKTWEFTREDGKFFIIYREDEEKEIKTEVPYEKWYEDLELNRQLVRWGTREKIG